MHKSRILHFQTHLHVLTRIWTLFHSLMITMEVTLRFLTSFHATHSYFILHSFLLLLPVSFSFFVAFSITNLSVRVPTTAPPRCYLGHAQLCCFFNLFQGSLSNLFTHLIDMWNGQKSPPTIYCNKSLFIILTLTIQFAQHVCQCDIQLLGMQRRTVIPTS